MRVKKGHSPSFWVCLFFLLDFDVVNSTELICENDQKEQDGSLVCSFRVPSSSWTPQSANKEEKLQDCVKNICIQAVVSKHLTKEEFDNPKEDLSSLKLGRATYRQPFSQYGPTISTLLEQIPSTLTTENVYDWVLFYNDLGNEYLGDSSNTWYELELAINALEQVLILKNQVNSKNLFPEDYFALVEARLGDAYMRDPKLPHSAAKALEHYQRAKDQYKSIIKEPPNGITKDQLEKEQTYARISSKVGIAGITMLQMQLDELIGNGVIRAEGSSKIYNPQNEESSEDIITRARLAFETAIQVHERQFRFLSNRSDAFFIQLCLDYAVTLQYLSTAATLTGNLHEAEKHLMHALTVLYDRKDYADDDSVNNIVDIEMGEKRLVATVGSVLISLSDVAIQLGDYEKSNNAYSYAMQIYQNFSSDIPLPPLDAKKDHTSEDHQYLETLLHDHFALLKSYRQKETQQDDAYEGDLLYNLGVLLYNLGDMEAATWFEQAIGLYENCQDRKQQIASAKTTLSNLYFHMKKFQDSQRVGRVHTFLFQSQVPLSFSNKKQTLFLLSQLDRSALRH